MLCCADLCRLPRLSSSTCCGVLLLGGHLVGPDRWMHTKLREFWEPGTIDTVLYHKGVFSYIGYNVPLEPHETCRQSRPPFSKNGLDNLGSGSGGGLRDHQNHSFINSEFLYMHYLHIYQPIATVIDQPGMYCVLSRRRVSGSVVPTVAAALDFGH